ncbi:MAG: hypothetical protein O9972_48010 [Burkholderiales bacterium]|nr:hypothetical protein [Burkholderiales bacterium]
MPSDILSRLDEIDARERSARPATPANVAGNSNLLQWADDNVRRAADNATFGYADKLAARASTLFGGDYDTALREERQRTEDAGKRLGRGAIVADVAGGVGGALAGGALVRGGAALSALRGGSTAPARAILAGDNAGVAGRAAVGAAEGLGMAALDAAGHDRALTGENLLTSAATGAGVAGGLAALGRARLPTNPSAEERRLADVLRAEGIELTAGQRTGSRPIQWMESTLADMPFTGQPGARIADQQARAFNAAALRRAGSTADEATGPTLSATQRALGARIGAIAGRNTVQFDQRFGDDLLDVVRRQGVLLPEFQKENILRIVRDLGVQGGSLPGTAYQKNRSRLTEMARNAGSDGEYRAALKGLRDALDGAAARSMRPGDAEAWTRTLRQYANYKAIEKAMGAAGEEVAKGNISPRALRTAVKARDPAGYVQGRGDLTDLVHAGEAFLKPLPNSGTAPRNLYQGLVMGGTPGGAIGGLLGGLPGAAVGMALSVGGPAVASRALYSRPVQRFLGSGAPNDPAGDLSKALLQGGYGAGLLGGTEERR